MISLEQLIKNFNPFKNNVIKLIVEKKKKTKKKTETKNLKIAKTKKGNPMFLSKCGASK